MTISEVQKQYPQAVPPTQEIGRLGTGAKEKLRFSGVKIGERSFNARFYFIDDHLTQISLSLDHPPSFAGATIIFDSVLDLLRAKYGPELSLDRRGGVWPSLTAKWLLGKSNITLLCAGIGGNPAFLDVIYHATLATDASNL